jgi:hypothetical protein
MILFEQTAAFIPDLFRALPDLEYIADQPGPRGRAFRSDAVRCRSNSGLTSAPRQAREASYEHAGLQVDAGGSQLTPWVLPLSNRSIRSLERRSAPL